MEARLDAKEEAIKNLQKEMNELKKTMQAHITKDTTTRTRRGS
jgi:hypothetical protein